MVFNRRGLKVLVNTTDLAEFDFEMYGISEEKLEQIERNFTKLPYSRNDHVVGSVIIRPIPDIYETAYILHTDGLTGHPVILIMGLAPKGEMVSWAEHLTDATIEQFAPGVRKLLSPRDRKS